MHCSKFKKVTFAIPNAIHRSHFCLKNGCVVCSNVFSGDSVKLACQQLLGPFSVKGLGVPFIILMNKTKSILHNFCLFSPSHAMKAA